jgi:predicted amidohydrolase
VGVRAVKIALAATNMSKRIETPTGLITRIRRLALEATGCDVLVLPEYFAMLVLDYAPELKPTEEVAWMANEIEQMDLLNETSKICESFGVAILSGTWPVETNSGYKNRAFFITEEGVIHTQDKLALTDEEHDRLGWYLQKGGELNTFEFQGVRCGISICHDTTYREEFEKFKSEEVELVFMPSMCEMEGSAKAIDSHAYIFDHARKRSEEVSCFFACVGSVGAQVLPHRTEKNTGGAALYKDGNVVAEIGPFEKGRGTSAMILKVEVDL